MRFYIVACRVQEQENQKRQLCEELEQLKTPQDSREASCQTPAPEEEVREEGRMCRLDHGPISNKQQQQLLAFTILINNVMLKAGFVMSKS